jgi:hypothetical protein
VPTLGQIEPQASSANVQETVAGTNGASDMPSSVVSEVTPTPVVPEDPKKQSGELHIKGGSEESTGPTEDTIFIDRDGTFHGLTPS